MALLMTDVTKVILEILEKKLMISNDCLKCEKWNAPLTGDPFYLSAPKLTYLILEIEKAFDVRFNEHILANYGLCSIEKIAKALQDSNT